MRGATILRNKPAAARIAAQKCEDDYAKAYHRLFHARREHETAAMSDTDLAAEIRDLAARRDITDAVQRICAASTGSTATAC